MIILRVSQAESVALGPDLLDVVARRDVLRRGSLVAQPAVRRLPSAVGGDREAALWPPPFH
eukprot:11080957-Lingulodinium_polyedra.AAC.1